MPDLSKPNTALLVALGAAGLLAAAMGRQPADLLAARPEPRHRRGADGQALPEGKGHDAARPSEIPARGWWDILKRTVVQADEDRLMTEAAGMTFFTLLALFPAIAALVSLYGLFADPATIADHLAAMGSVVPESGMQIINDQVQRIASKGGGSLGFGLALGLATSLWSANQAITALVDALNVVFEEKEKRGFFLRKALTLGMTFGALVFVLLAIAAVVVLPVVLELVGLSAVGEVLLRYARWPVLLVTAVLFLSVVYRYGPSRRRAQWRWVSWGSAAAAVLWVLVSLAFSFYVSNFGNYNATYGSLGAVVGFLTWIWISSIVVLFGAELNAEMEHQTARDTTRAPEKPMGQRGARMADTVAH